MKKRFRFLAKFISIIVVVSVMCSSSIISVYSAGGNRFESEGNNTIASADITYDDYNSYGSISYIGDFDYWKVTFSTEGMVNFYLGNIPSGCDYNMEICDSGGVPSWAMDLQSGSAHELIRLHVKANTPYYIRIYSPLYDSSSSNYLLRVKWYPLNDALYYSYTSEANEAHNMRGIDTVAMGENALWYFYDMNFTEIYNFTNHEASAVLSSMPFAQLMILDNHGSPGLIVLPSMSSRSTLYAASNSQMTSDDRAISTLASSSLSNSSLIIFFACNTGNDDSNGNNLVDAAVSKGAIASFGWKNSISASLGEEWMDLFLDNCSQGEPIYYAAELADEQLVQSIRGINLSNVEKDKLFAKAEALSNRYYGSLRAEANAKATVLSLCK